MLKADPRSTQVRIQLITRWVMTGLLALALALVSYGWVRSPSQTGGWIAAIVFFGGGWLVCFVIFAPPSIKATAERVSVWGDYGYAILQRLPRSDLAYIFRGIGNLGGRLGWGRAYFLVTNDDTPKVIIKAEDFTDTGMVELAARLKVPIEGDFTARVN